ncbi:hypothetical protein LA080_014616 [Diaporthe eres]|nr:hypothetical protein LA080_014616 [Diaporthe eres]
MGGTGNSVRDGLRMLLSGVVQTSSPLGAAGLVSSQLCALCARRAPRPRKLRAARGGSRPGFVVDVGVLVNQCSPVTARQRCSARAGDWRRSRCCGKGVGVEGGAGRIREAAAKRDGSSDDSEGSAESGWACGQRWGGMRRVLQYVLPGRARSRDRSVMPRRAAALHKDSPSYSNENSEECGGASMIGVSAHSWTLSCAVRPVPPHLAWPDLVSSRVVSCQTLLVPASRVTPEKKPRAIIVIIGIGIVMVTVIVIATHSHHETPLLVVSIRTWHVAVLPFNVPVASVVLGPSSSTVTVA